VNNVHNLTTDSNVSDAEVLRQTMAMLGVAPPPPPRKPIGINLAAAEREKDPAYIAARIAEADADDTTYIAARRDVAAAEAALEHALAGRDPDAIHAARNVLQAAKGHAQFLVNASRQNPDLVAAYELRRLTKTPGSGYYIPAAPVAPPPPPALPAEVPGNTTPVERGNVLVSNLARLFSGFVYVQDVHQMATPDGTMLSQAQFDADKRFAGRTYPLTPDASDSTESAWEAFIDSQIAVFPHVRGTRFDPRQPEGAVVTVDKIDYVNIWRDPHVRSVPGDASRFAKHVKTLLPNGDDALILLCYMAACVQHRGVKAKYAPFIQGLPGNGKSLLGEKIMAYALGHNYVIKARSKSLDSQFNASFYGSLMVLVDDVKVRGDVFEALKPMVTDETMQIEAKGVNSVNRAVCFNFMFSANPKDGLRKTADDRRICPLFCAQQEPGDLERDGLTQEYFKKFFHWLDHEDGLAIVAHYLQHFEIDPRYNFAAGCVRAPRTTSTDEAVQVGHGAARQRMQELIDAEDTDGLKGGWVNWTKFNRLLDADAEGRHMSPGARRDLLAQMGYVKHPGVNSGTRSEGQVPNKLADGSKPYLWIKRDHDFVSLQGVRVAQYYVAAQAGTAPPPPEAK
jgi:uncharacterized protein DUF5906